MTTSSSSVIEDENAHVQELKKLFLSCCINGEQVLNSSGLQALCEKLKLSEFGYEISERVLNGYKFVDFNTFKERFVSILPEIIDVSSGQVDPIAYRIKETALRLGYNEGHRLSRYDIRLLCENTPGLEQLSIIDVNRIYDSCDSHESNGISIYDFIMQYRIMRQQCSEEQFVADPYISSLNLFEELENRDTRSVDIYELTEYWNKNGINFEESFTVLKDCGESLITNGTVNTDRLSGYLEDELNKYLPTLNPTVKCAVVSLYRCLEYMKAQLRESEKNVAYFTKQLELANQRSTMLIEELDHNQWTIEQNCEKKLKELEEHQHMRIMELEERHEQEKLFMQKEITKLEEELTHNRQVKQSMRSRLILVERQNNRMGEENAELSANVTRLEQHNAQLKADIIKIRQPDDSKQLVLWKQKVDLLVNHNKRLREKISELTAASQAKALEKNRKYADEEPSTSVAEAPSIWSPAFRSQVALLRKRREAVVAKGNILDTASDMETEPEGIFFRQKQRRKLKRKDRYKRLSERKLIFEKMKANENGDSGLNRSDSSSTFQHLDRRKRSLMENITGSLSATCSARARDSTTTSRPNSGSSFLNVSPRTALSFLDFGASARKRLNGK